MPKFIKRNAFLFQIVLNLFVFAFLINSGLTQEATAQIVIPNQPIPGVKPVTLLELQNIVGVIGNFFVIVGPVLLIIALILSGITLATGGASQTAVAKAKKWFGYSLVGGLIIFGSGVIINTIAAIVTRRFFCRLGFDFGPATVCFIR